VSSKTFGTLETLTNARLCKAWLLDGLADLLEGQDEAGIAGAAAKPALQQAEPPVIAMEGADAALGIGEFRLPDQGAVAEHPQAVVARRPAGERPSEAGPEFVVG
jgi:hypothetical protein